MQTSVTAALNSLILNLTICGDLFYKWTTDPTLSVERFGFFLKEMIIKAPFSLAHKKFRRGGPVCP